MSMFELRRIMRNKLMLSVAFTSALVVAITSYAIFAYIDIDHKTQDLKDLYTIRDAVNEANQAIKSAAIAPDMQSKVIELAKRFETRKQADRAFESFGNRKHIRVVEHEFLLMKLQRNGIYRASQNRVVLLIEEGIPDRDLWKEMVWYQLHQGRYMKHLNTLTGMITDELNANYRMLLQLIIAFIFALVMCANYIVSHALSNHWSEK